MTAIVEVQAYFSVNGTEQEVTLHVTGVYHRAVKAWTYAGEYAPTDPPEPAMFEWEKIEVYDMQACKFAPLPFPIGPELAQAITEAAIDAYEANAGSF